MPRMIIGFAGKMQSGKTTAKNSVGRSLRHLPCNTIPFAESVKEFAYAMGWDGEKNAKGRRLLQVIGTECGRAYDKDIWVKLVQEKINDTIGTHGYALIDDVRFPNEAEFINEANGLLILIERPRPLGYWIKYFLSIKRIFHFFHKSERGLDKKYFDYVVVNSGNMNDLERTVTNIVKIEMEKRGINYITNEVEDVRKRK